MPLLGDDHVITTTELDNFPAAIEPRDLIDISSQDPSFDFRHVTPRMLPVHSAREYAWWDTASFSTIDEESPRITSQSGDQEGQQSHAVLESELITNASKQFYSYETQSTEQGSSQNDIVSHEAFRPKNRQNLQADRSWPMHREIDPGKSYAPVLPELGTSTSSASGPSISDLSNHDVSTYGLYITVRSSEPWNMPLLPLLSPPKSSRITASRVQNHHALEALPFVTIPGVPFRLPGPTH